MVKCPNCGSEDWEYTGIPIISKLDDNDYAIHSYPPIQIDFRCYCYDCTEFFCRREVYIHSGKKTEWFVEESEEDEEME